MIGIIILNYNSANDTIKCISSIRANTKLPFKIYLVDGCSQDNSFEFLSSYLYEFENIELIKADYNGGYSYGNNIGIKRAIEDNCNALLIINPDVIVKNNAIDLMYETLICDDNLSVVGPRIIYVNNTDMQFASKLYTFKGFLSTRKPFAYFNLQNKNTIRFYKFNPEKDFRFQGMVSGCCFMIKNKDFKEMGLFDTNLFLYYEEDIIAYKLAKLNKWTKIATEAVVIHNHSASVSKEGEAFVRFHRFYSSQYVLRVYAGINDIQFIFASILHIFPFALNSLINKSYRKYFFKFLRKLLYLFANHMKKAIHLFMFSFLNLLL